MVEIGSGQPTLSNRHPGRNLSGPTTRSPRITLCPWWKKSSSHLAEFKSTLTGDGLGIHLEQFEMFGDRVD